MSDRVVLELALFVIGVLIGRRWRVSRATLRHERAARRLEAEILAVREMRLGIVQMARAAGLAVEAAEVGQQGGERDQKHRVE